MLGVPTLVTFEWEACTDVNAIALWLSVEADDKSAIEGGGYIDDPTTTSFGPVPLSPGVFYDDAHLDFTQAYFANNDDGIGYVVEKSSIAAFVFTTVPEPATLFVMLAAGLPVLLKRQRANSC